MFYPHATSHQWITDAANSGGLLANSGTVTGTALGSASGIGRFALNQTLQNTTSAALGQALGQEGDLGDALRNSLANTFAAAGFNWVGDVSLQRRLQEGGLAKTGLHTLMGGLAAEAAGDDFRTGALAGGINEMVAGALSQRYADLTVDQMVLGSQLLGVIAASTQSADAESLEAGAWAAGNASKYNHGFHLPAGLREYGQSATSLAQHMQEEGSSPEAINVALQEMNQGIGFDGPKPANSFLEAWVYSMLTGGGYMKAGTTAGGLLLGGSLGGGTNVVHQLSDGGLQDFSITDASVATVVGSMTQGRGFWATEGISIGGAYVGSEIKGVDPKGAMVGAGVGAAVGRVGEKVSTKKLNFYFPSEAADFAGGVFGTITNEKISSEFQEWMGSDEK